MTSTIKIKNSSTAGAVPGSGDLVQGELAVNVTDKKIYTKNASGTVVNLGTTPSITDNGNAEAIVIDSSENVGVGVSPSAWDSSNFKALEIPAGSLNAYQTSQINLTQNAYYTTAPTYWAYKNTAAASLYRQSGGIHSWHYAASGTAGNSISFTQAMTLDASGNLLVGTTTAYDTITAKANSSANAIAIVGRSSDNIGFLNFYNANGTVAASIGNNPTALEFDVAGAERMRIDSSGNLLVGDTSAVGKIYSYVNSSTLPAIHARQDGTAYIQSWVIAAGAMRAYIKTDGGLGNYSANNVNLSDERMKTDISLAGSYLAKICAIPVKTFKYKDQTDDTLNLGVIAQDVEAVAPELVDNSGWGAEVDQPEDGVPLKAIYQTDLQYALMKALQELKAEFDAYKATHP